MTERFILDIQSKYQTVPAKIFYKFKMSDLNQSIHVITSRVGHRSFRNAGSDQKDNATCTSGVVWYQKIYWKFFFNHDLVSYISVAITFFGKCRLRTFRCSHKLFYNYGRKRTKTVTQTVHIYKRIDDFWNRFHFWMPFAKFLSHKDFRHQRNRQTFWPTSLIVSFNIDCEARRKF